MKKQLLSQGTTVEAIIIRVVDGDTVVVQIGKTEEKLRLACLDTEESHHGSDKPVTPWGKKAKEEAMRFFDHQAEVILEFAGNEPLETCFERYRDNFGRLLVWIHREGEDFQEHMIHEAYSPYFTKYGFADFLDHHERYTAAQREAQASHRGLWDQIEVNGSETRNYALLGVWWDLRAQVIEEYRGLRSNQPNLLNSRRDYQEILHLAAEGKEAIVFTELRSYSRVGQSNAVVDIGSKRHPFKVFLPDVEGPEGQRILRLLGNRYIGDGSDHPRRGYAYVRGPLKLFRDEPEVIVTDVNQITDSPAG